MVPTPTAQPARWWRCAGKQGSGRDLSGAAHLAAQSKATTGCFARAGGEARVFAPDDCLALDVCFFSCSISSFASHSGPFTSHPGRAGLGDYWRATRATGSSMSYHHEPVPSGIAPPPLRGRHAGPKGVIIIDPPQDTSSHLHLQRTLKPYLVHAPELTPSTFTLSSPAGGH